MSEHEFEQYLRLLGGMLRLNARQRQELAAELRDHLEQRLAELVAEGVTREKAILEALEEFGDTAGLAQEFSGIFKQQQRSRIMKFTALSVMGLTAAVLVFMAMTPQNARIPLARTTDAQVTDANGTDANGTDAKGTDAQGTKPQTDGPDGQKRPTRSANRTLPSDHGDMASVRANNAVAEAKLAQRIPVEFVDVPFLEVLEHVSQAAGIQYHVDRKSLEECGIPPDYPIRLELKHVRIDMALDLVLRQLGNNFTYVIRDGIVVIAREEDIDANTEVRVYDCRELLRIAAGTMIPATPPVALPGDMPGSDSSLPRVQPPANNPKSKTTTEQSHNGTLPPDVLAQFGRGELVARNGMPGGASASTRVATQLMDVITASIAPDSWANMGGTGSVSEFGGMLVVSHNAKVHQQVEQVLRMLHETALRDLTHRAP